MALDIPRSWVQFQGTHMENNLECQALGIEQVQCVNRCSLMTINKSPMQIVIHVEFQRTSRLLYFDYTLQTHATVNRSQLR